MLNSRLLITSLLAAFTLVASAGAATLFSTLGQSQDNGYSFTGGRLASDFNTGAWVSTVTGLTIAIARISSSDVVTARLYTDVAGVPGTLLGSFTPITIPGNASFGAGINYSATTSGITLAPDTIYWLDLTITSAVGTPIHTNNVTDGGSLFSSVSATQVKRSFDGTSWSDASAGNLIYSLSGTASAAPEPSRALLMLCGLGMVVFHRRRR